jgi:hypothetical protein
MLEEMAGGALGALTAGAMVGRMRRRRATRHAATNRAELGLRIALGTHDGLRGGWLSGIATLSPGRLEFAGYLGGVRFLRRATVIVEVSPPRSTKRRKPAGSELFWLTPACEIVTVTTPTATLELAVPPPIRLAWVLATIAPRR